MSKSVKINDHSQSIVAYVAEQKGLDENAAADYLLGISWSRYQAVTKYAQKGRPEGAAKRTKKDVAKKAKKDVAKKAKKGAAKKGAAKKAVKAKKKAEPQIELEDETNDEV